MDNNNYNISVIQDIKDNNQLSQDFIPSEKEYDEIIQTVMNNNQKLINHNTRVLFILGMDSSQKNRKANVVRKHFKNCCIPNIEASYYKLNKKNSLLKNLFSNWLNLKKTGMEVLQSCVDIVKKDIQEFKPDIVIGMSMGGAVLTAILSGLENKTFQNTQIKNDIWNGPCILIAPALETLMKKTFNKKENKQWQQNFTQLTQHNNNIHIIHGTKDKVIPYKNSQHIVNNLQPKIKLHTVEKGNHKLNNYIIQQNELVKKINEIIQNQQQQELQI